jgi:putative acetyltransferase
MAALNKEVRECQPDDLPALEALYAAAFPDENLLPLLRELLNGECDVLSLVAGTDAGPLGHAVFTRCTTTNRSTPVALLGPVAVAPARHGQGIGSAIIRKGLGILHTEGTARVLVLGDPAFYGRLGFVPDACIAPPYPLPDEWRDAWQSVNLHAAEPPLEGKLSVPHAWRQAKLWGF